MLGNLHVRFGVGVGVKLPGPHHNLATGKKIRIKSPARLRAAVGDDNAKTHKATKKAKATAEAQQAATSTPRGEDVAKTESVSGVCTKP